jgi:hypothetical protein
MTNLSLRPQNELLLMKPCRCKTLPLSDSDGAEDVLKKKRLAMDCA